MTDQLVSWLGDADHVVTAAITLLKHLREFGHALGDLHLSECWPVLVLRPGLRWLGRGVSGAWGQLRRRGPRSDR